jgi:hypothetical protein
MASTPISPQIGAVACDFVLVLSRMTVLVLDLQKRYEREYEHHFIEHEHEICPVPKR